MATNLRVPVSLERPRPQNSGHALSILDLIMAMYWCSTRAVYLIMSMSSSRCVGSSIGGKSSRQPGVASNEALGCLLGRYRLASGARFRERGCPADAPALALAASCGPSCLVELSGVVGRDWSVRCVHGPRVSSAVLVFAGETGVIRRRLRANGRAHFGQRCRAPC